MDFGNKDASVSKHDLSQMLVEWPFNMEMVSARWITGADGQPYVQLRLDIGILQMRIAGRPDGATPRGYPSLLDYYLTREAEEEDEAALDLNAEACHELQQEAVQYYYRYLAFSALNHADGVIEDTAHNLDLIDLVARYAENDDLAWQFLQHFPYVRMMNVRALADKAVTAGDYDTAQRFLDQAAEDIREFWNEYGEDEDDHSQDHEVKALEEMRSIVRQKRPRSEAEQVRDSLQEAIVTENYERAAKLRDRLSKLEKRRVG